MKKVLVLGGAFQHMKVVEAGHRLGYKMFVTDYLENSPAKRIADVALNYDVNDIESIVAFCKREQIDGVINLSLDPCQIPYCKICDELRLPCFGNINQFNMLTNKRLFKNLCVEYDVGIVPTYRYEEMSDKLYPVIVKPVDSRGSRGISICHSSEELPTAIQKAQKESSTNSYTIEKYMNNAQDFTLAYIFINGEGILIRTGDRYTGNELHGMNNVAVLVSSPSKYTDLFIERDNEKIIKMLKGIGIKNGPIFFQGFVDNGEVKLYDPGFRFSGGEYERLFYEITGIDLVEMIVKYSVTGKMRELKNKDYFRLGGKHLVHFDPYLYSGKIDEIYGLEDVKKHPCVRTLNVRYKVGDVVPNSNTVQRRFAEICIITESILEEQDTLDYIKTNLRVVSDAKEEMICNYEI